MIDKLIENVLTAMQDSLSEEQLQKLENVLAIQFHGIEVREEQTALVVAEQGWEKVLRLYKASKRLENCSEGTLENYERCIKMLFGTLGKDFRQITTNDLRYYLAMYRERRKVSLSYLETLRHYLLSFFSWLQDEGYIQKNPAKRLKRIKVPKKIQHAYTAAEREMMRCNVKQERDLALLEVLYCTAGRIGEIMALNRTDINFSGMDVIIYGEKGKMERRVYLTEEAAYHLKLYLDSRTDTNPALFVTLKAPHERLSKSGVQAMLRKLGKRLGIHAHPHKFRRSLLTDAGARGIPLQEIQKYAGHKKPDTTMLYVDIREDNVQASFRKYIA